MKKTTLNPQARPNNAQPYRKVTDEGLLLVIPGEVPPGMNVTFKMHWAERNRTKDYWKLLIRAAVGRDIPNYQHAEIKMTMYRMQEMDNDNKQSCFKFIGDALRDLKVIPDDKPKYIKTKIEIVKVRHMVDKKTEILLKAWDGKP